MQNLNRIVFFVVIGCLWGVQSEAFVVKARAGKTRKTSCIVSIEGKDELIRHLGRVIAFDMDFSGQFKTSLNHDISKRSDKNYHKALFEKGIDLCVYLLDLSFEGRKRVGLEVVQTWLGKKVYSKTVNLKTEKAIKHGHSISEKLLLALTGKKGICCSTLAWCEGDKVVCSDYAGMQSSEVVRSPGMKFAPSFHTKAPLLFFSHATDRNSELSSIDLSTGRQRVRFSYPGLTMQFAFSPDGTKGITCMSGSRGNTELYLYDQALCNSLGKQAFTQLTKNNGANVSPCFLSNGDVIFCSDYQTGRNGRPQLYYLDAKTKKTVRLTSGIGYCAAPSYCEKNKKVVFNKPINGVFQLFCLSLKDFDVTTFKDGIGLPIKQLTFGGQDKTEPQWHPEGDFVAFMQSARGQKTARKAQVAIFSAVDGAVRVITQSATGRGFPAWTDRTLY
ncbi:hypothetical protein KAU11_00805 [Candidatus Babeliales bacterium]|nr:hypothetical protein [Candidatus Babeliales bacterium]